jgi:uncharacterized protein (TIGR00106 family)
MAMMDISVVPVGTGSASVSEYVAGAVKIAQSEKGVTCRLCPMGTVLEGDTDTLLAVAGRMHRSALDAGALRVVTTIKLDERTDKPLTMDGKIRAVEAKLG